MTATARTAQIARQEMEVDQTDRVVLAVEHLVVPDAPECEHSATPSLAAFDARLGPLLSDLLDQFDGHSPAIQEFQAIDDLLRRVTLFDTLDVVFPAHGLVRQPLGRHAGFGILGQQHVGDGVVIADVAVDGLQVVAVTRVDGLQAGHRTRRPRVGHQSGNALSLLVVGHSPEQNRMSFPSVVTPESDEVGVLDVLVTCWGRIGAVGVEVAGHGRRHAHSGVGFDRIAADDALHDDVFDPLGLHGQLARAVQSDGVAASLFDDFGQFLGYQLFGLFIGHLDEHVVVETAFGFRDVASQRIAHVFADEHLFEPVQIDRFMSVQAFDALNAAVARMFLVGHHADHLALLHLDQRPASDTAVRAG